MSRPLGIEDRQAIDLLLDKSQSRAGFVAGAEVDPARLNAVHAVLHLLDHLPADEPAPDLMARTLSRVEAEQNAAMLPPALRPTISGQQTHA